MHKMRILITVVMAALLVLSSAMSASAGSTALDLTTNFTIVNLDDTVDGSGDPVPNAGEVTFWTESSPGIFEENTASFQLVGVGDQMQFRQYWSTAPNPDLPEGPGSAVVASSGRLAAIAQIFANDQNPTQRGAYTAFSAGASQFFVPNVQRMNPTRSGTGNSQIVVQNSGSGDVTGVTIDLVAGDGSLVYTKNIDSIGAGQSFYYDLADEDEGNVPSPWVGSAVVRAGDGQVVVVSNLFTGLTLNTFNAFADAAADTTVFVPYFASRLSTMDGPSSTSVSIQNVSDTEIPAGGLVVKFYPNPQSPSGSYQEFTNADAVGPSASFYVNPVTDMTIPANMYGSCVIESTQNVVAIVQVRATSTAMAGAYEALGAASASENVVVPLIAKRLGNGLSTSVTVQNVSSEDAQVLLTYTPSSEYAGSQDPIELGPYTIAAGANLNHNHRTPGGVPEIPAGFVGSLTISSDQPVVSYVLMSFVKDINPSLGGDTYMAHDAIPF